LAAAARRAFAIVLLPLAVLWFGGLEYRGLFEPDEGRYAEIPREMLESGDWVTPRLNGLKYFEKPPLQYWVTALGYAALGVDEWTARLWPAITGFLGILLLAFAGSRLGPPGTGHLAGLILAGSLGYFLAAQYLTLDMALTFFLTSALCALLLAQGEAQPASVRRNWMLAAWASAACAVMTKGLIGAVLPGMALVAYAMARRDWSLFRRLELRWGLALFALIVLPWHVLAQWRNPEFFSFYIVHEHFARYLLPEHHRPGAWWYFSVMLLLSVLPWTTALPGVFRRTMRRSRLRGAFDPDTFLLVWIVVILVFFSLSRSKLPAYILPVVPALALLIARDVARRGVFDGRWPGLLLSLGGAIALESGLSHLTRAMAIEDLVFAYFPWFIAGVAVLVAGGFLAWRMRADRIALRIATLTLATVFGTQILLSGLHPMDDRFSAETFTEQLLGGEGFAFAPGAPFYSVGYFDESLPFYLGRTFTLVSYQGELGPGITAEPGKYVESLEEFKRRWVASDDAYAAMPPQQYAALKAEGLPMRLLGDDPKRVVVSRSREDPPRRAKNPGWLYWWLQPPAGPVQR
jgi:4-amino-4-deoxy-L-arabinose transferase-like glycosyltransferase